MQEDNGLNIINEDKTAKLLFKLPGSDANPYLTLFSLLTSVIISINYIYFIFRLIMA